jgi:plasmid stability protein
MVFYMKTITLKDIPDSIHGALKQRARRHGRSLNKEALACLERMVTASPVDTAALLHDIRKHRATLPGRLTDGMIAEANEGRP